MKDLDNIVNDSFNRSEFKPSSPSFLAKIGKQVRDYAFIFALGIGGAYSNDSFAEEKNNTSTYGDCEFYDVSGQNGLAGIFSATFNKETKTIRLHVGKATETCYDLIAKEAGTTPAIQFVNFKVASDGGFTNEVMTVPFAFSENTTYELNLIENPGITYNNIRLRLVPLDQPSGRNDQSSGRNDQPSGRNDGWASTYVSQLPEISQEDESGSTGTVDVPIVERNTCGIEVIHPAKKDESPTIDTYASTSSDIDISDTTTDDTFRIYNNTGSASNKIAKNGAVRIVRIYHELKNRIAKLCKDGSGYKWSKLEKAVTIDDDLRARDDNCDLNDVEISGEELAKTKFTDMFNFGKNIKDFSVYAVNRTKDTFNYCAYVQTQNSIKRRAEIFFSDLFLAATVLHAGNVYGTGRGTTYKPKTIVIDVLK